MRKNKDIVEILYRYILDQCTPEEIEVVITYFKDSPGSSTVPSVNEVLEFLREHDKMTNVSSDLPFEQVLRAGKDMERTALALRGKKKIWKKYASIAALFIGVMVSGYIFWQNQFYDDSIIIPSDAITLELEDGSIEILDEDGSKEVVDENGNVLGQQKGGQISYEDTGLTEELVYNTLTVPYGRRFELKLSDGSTVHLNAGTSLKYPVKFLSGLNRKVYLTGEAFFGVSKDAAHPFIVNADNLNVRVLGTRFNISSYPEDDRTDVVLVEGSVGMHEKNTVFDAGKSTILEPGFKGSFEKSNGKIETRAVVTDIYTSWIGGELVFRNMTFENILKKLERHYDVSITNNNTDLAKEVFNASYGQMSLHTVLEDLKLTHGIKYSIDKTNITIN